MARRSGSASYRSGYVDSRFRDRLTTPVYVTVPVPAALRVRTVSYSYPSSRVRSRRVVRVALGARPGRYRMARVVVRAPRHLPLVPGSYVSVDRNRVNIHSRRQLRRLMREEFNRPRYSERKARRRQARNGQMESVRGDRLGMIGEAYRRGLGAARIADAAMVSRALGAS